MKNKFDYHIEKLNKQINMVYNHLDITWKIVYDRARYLTSHDRFKNKSQSAGKKKRRYKRTLKRKNKKKLVRKSLKKNVSIKSKSKSQLKR